MEEYPPSQKKIGDRGTLKGTGEWLFVDDNSMS
jgi:hypothetical protein